MKTYNMTSNYSYFHPGEYSSRCLDLSALMDLNNIDQCILTGKENINYFAGYDFGELQIDDKYFNCFLIISRDHNSGPVLLVGEGNEGTASMSWIKDRRFFKYNKRQFMGAQYDGLLKEVIHEKSTKNNILGLEIGPGMKPDYHVYRFLRDNFANMKIKDCSGIIWKLRKIKSPGEIEVIRKSCEITCRGYIEGFKSIHEGVEEKNISSIMGAKMMEEGADCFGSGVVMLYSGKDRGTWCDALPSNYCLRKGDLAQVDGGCSYRGYKSDIMRMASVGKPDRTQSDNFKIALEAFYKSVELVKDGIACKKIWLQAEKIWSKYGLDDFIKNRRKDNWCTNGHGVGLDIHEPPVISLAEDEELRSGMVITIEAFNTHNGTWPLKDAEWWYVIENMILVKENSYEILSSFMDNELWIA